MEIPPLFSFEMDDCVRKTPIISVATDCFAPLECASNCKSSGRIISGVMSRFYHKVTVRLELELAMQV